MKHGAIWYPTLAIAAIGGAAATPMVRPNQAAPPTYVKDIAPIIHRKCSPCHRPGAVGPFDLISYEDVVKRSPLVRIQAMIKAMPPGQAHSDLGELSLTPELTDDEVLLLQQWFQAKLQRGEGPEPKPAMPPVKWPMGAPGFTVSSPAGVPEVRKEGLRYWVTYAIDVPANKGPLVGFDILPNSPQALRNAMVAIVTPGAAPKKIWAESAGSLEVKGDAVLGRWAPGFRNWKLPQGYGKLIPPGSKLLVMAHYQPIGKPEDAGFKVGLYFGKTAASKPPKTISLEHPPFEVLAKKSSELKLSYVVDRPMRLVSISPEARFFCSKITIVATAPGQEPKTLFETYKWDPYLAGPYTFASPARLAKGTKIEASFTYNNDENCRANANKIPALVRSGKTLNDEMCRLHMLVVQE